MTRINAKKKIPRARHQNPPVAVDVTLLISFSFRMLPFPVRYFRSQNI
jgi:hypothetical protein